MESSVSTSTPGNISRSKSDFAWKSVTSTRISDFMWDFLSVVIRDPLQHDCEGEITMCLSRFYPGLSFTLLLREKRPFRIKLLVQCLISGSKKAMNAAITEFQRRTSDRFSKLCPRRPFLLMATPRLNYTLVYSKYYLFLFENACLYLTLR